MSFMDTILRWAVSGITVVVILSVLARMAWALVREMWDD